MNQSSLRLLTLSDNFGSIVAYLHGIGYTLVKLILKNYHYEQYSSETNIDI